MAKENTAANSEAKQSAVEETKPKKVATKAKQEDTATEEVSPATEAAAEETKATPKKAKTPKRATEKPVEDVEYVENPDDVAELNASTATPDRDIDAEIARNSSRFAHEVAKATKEERKNMYRSEHVITEYGDEEIETEETLMRKDYLELVASSKSNKILKGRLIGFRYAGETRKSTCLAEVEYGSGLCTVLIPSYVLYDYDLNNYIDNNQLQLIENSIVGRIGSDVKFIVRHVNERDMIAYGDRLMAQSIIGFDNWLKVLRDGKPRIVEGLIVKGQVCQVYPNFAIIDSLGCEIRVPREEISHAYVGDAKQELKVGQYVNVRVKDITQTLVEKNNTNYRLVSATGSIKDATSNHKKKMFDQFRVDGKYAATVTYVEEAGVFCRMRGNIDVLCALPRYGDNPVKGEQRIVKITEKNPEKLFLFGVFVSN